MGRLFEQEGKGGVESQHGSNNLQVVARAVALWLTVAPAADGFGQTKGSREELKEPVLVVLGVLSKAGRKKMKETKKRR